MKLGIGLYRHLLTRDNFRFARQAGATHLVAHWVDYFKQGDGNSRGDQPTGGQEGWGLAGDPDKLWETKDLVQLKRAAAEEGLVLEAIENFDPAHWYDVLLDGPRRVQHINNIQETIRRVGEAEIPLMGYNFSIAGVCGRTTEASARGNAVAVCMEGPCDTPLPFGMAWNMVVDPSAPKGTVPSATQEQLWDRFERFLEEVLPVAEQSGVRLALHPDDPPLEFMRGQPRLVYQPDLYQRSLDLVSSPSNQLEFCIGTLAEMKDGNVYDATEQYAAQKKIGYVHLRNVTGKAPHYRETFIDDGDVDIFQILRILQSHDFDGVIVPDHTPQMSCNAPWHAGMAFALGYLKAAIQTIADQPSERLASTIV